ncbi:PAS domain-containing sensor histidine kinase [Actinokineospora sp. NBRC 105648]|uniref:sensor histidine kinase n=1 Tax=Actinokineospora sp. NBRC 105648 TaxID=3032206 RepID=UPI0024A2C488|nr:PAS domain-containing sensor histidine kinase [Actinokineospora sp. NBRC 105648]GLZ36865.1 hypothetical protein Acsp05_04900 [Actinokineospora sp. NBRC 105648]
MDFGLLFASSPSPYLVLDPDLVIVEVNPAYLAATGTERAALVGEHIFTAFPDNPDDETADGVRNLRRSLRAVLDTGRPDTMPLQRYDIAVGADGGYEERHWSPVNSPLIGPDGRIAYILHRVEDVTDLVTGRGTELAERLERMEVDLFVRARELKVANDRLAETSAALRAQQEAKDRFVAALSHELRNPLAALRAAAEVLGLDAPGHPALAVVERQLDTLGRMADDLLDAGRMAVGRLRVDQRRLDLREVARACVAAVRVGARRVVLDLPDEPVTVVGDRVRLDQVLSNLVVNAVKYSPADATIAVTLKTEEESALLTVRDNGFGFDPALAESLFDAFTRAAQPGARDVGGLGLGLLVVRGVVALHGGTVTAHSAGPGTGARFDVRIPLG